MWPDVGIKSSPKFPKVAQKVALTVLKYFIASVWPDVGIKSSQKFPKVAQKVA